ncbi:hypothetical protein H5968_13900 [Sphaerospermopsis sp. LEGE 00249]|nr:hypothetical protein [Sphaerospermopsis sp. LEGE 00249]
MGIGNWELGIYSKNLVFTQSPVTSHQSPVTSPQSPVPSHQSPITSPQSPVTSHQSPITNHQSLYSLCMPKVQLSADFDKLTSQTHTEFFY